MMRASHKIVFHPEMKQWIEQKKELQKKIHDISNRLRFGYSEALHDYQLQLIQEDVVLSCHLTAVLCEGLL